MEARINMITVAVDDLARSFAFFREGLGWKPWWPKDGRIEAADHAAFELENDLSLVLYPRRGLENDVGLPKAPPSSSEFVLTQIVPRREDVDAVLLRAKGAGATILGGPAEQPWGYAGEFRDPDGHVWQIMWNGGTGK